MNTGRRVANLISFFWISLRLLLYSFSSSDSCCFSFLVRFSPSFLACLTCSLLLMMVWMSSFRLRKPSMFIRAFMASSLASSRASVSLSTLTSSALSQRLASSVAEVPDMAKSRISAALICVIFAPS